MASILLGLQGILQLGSASLCSGRVPDPAWLQSVVGRYATVRAGPGATVGTNSVLFGMRVDRNCIHINTSLV